MFKLIKKFFMMLLGKANKAVEDNTSELEKLMLLRDDFENQTQRVKESLDLLESQEKYTDKQLEEMRTEISDLTEKLNFMKTTVQNGGTLSDDDKDRGERFLAKIQTIESTILTTQKLRDNIALEVSKIKNNVRELEAEKVKVNYSIRNAECIDKSTNAQNTSSKAMEIIYSDKTSQSMKTQLNKLEEKHILSEIKAKNVSIKSDTLDCEKNKSSLNDFLNS